MNNNTFNHLSLFIIGILFLFTSCKNDDNNFPDNKLNKTEAFTAEFKVDVSQILSSTSNASIENYRLINATENEVYLIIYYKNRDLDVYKIDTNGVLTHHISNEELNFSQQRKSIDYAHRGDIVFDPKGNMYFITADIYDYSETIFNKFDITSRQIQHYDFTPASLLTYYPDKDALLIQDNNLSFLNLDFPSPKKQKITLSSTEPIKKFFTENNAVSIFNGDVYFFEHNEELKKITFTDNNKATFQTLVNISSIKTNFQNSSMLDANNFICYSSDTDLIVGDISSQKVFPLFLKEEQKFAFDLYYQNGTSPDILVPADLNTIIRLSNVKNSYYGFDTFTTYNNNLWTTNGEYVVYFKDFLQQLSTAKYRSLPDPL
jgi:hypothetical protein